MDRQEQLRLQRLEDRVRQLEQRQLPRVVRFATGGGGGDELPKGTGRGKVLQLMDDLDPGTVGWDYEHFT